MDSPPMIKRAEKNNRQEKAREKRERKKNYREPQKQQQLGC